MKDTTNSGSGLSGSQRMYGIARVLSDFFDQCQENGIPITPEVQLKARDVAIAWLRANPLLEPEIRAQLDAHDRAQQERQAARNRPTAANE